MSTRKSPSTDKRKRRRSPILAVALAICVGSPAFAQDTPVVEGGGEAAPAGADAGGGGDEASQLQQLGFSPDDVTANTKISKIRGMQTAVPDVYRVKRGDTLWDITRVFFKNPYLWPAVWSYNPHITNPHWIYPEDLVFLTPNIASTGGDGTVSAGPASDASIRDLFAFTRQVGVMVIPVGYYTDDELGEKAGRVIFSPEEKTMLTITDEIYLDWEKKEVRKAVQVGERFGIYREGEPVINVDEDEPVARKFALVGMAEIIYNDGQKLPTALITDALEEIERHDIVMPLEDAIFRVTKQPNGADTEGRIIDTFDIVTQVGEQQFILINRGLDDGVKVGNRFTVFEQKEGIVELPPGKETRTAWAARHKKKRDEEREGKDLRDGKTKSAYERSWPLDEETNAPVFPEPEDEDGWHTEREYELSDLPLRQIGEIIVVKSTDRFCTALIVDSEHELNLGTRVTMINKY